MRIAVVGTGQVARGAHLPVFNRLQGVSVVALADSDATSLAAAGALVPSAKTGRSLSEILSSTPIDVVDICTPPASHAKLILEALEAGVHVLCEKPLVLDLRVLEKIRALSQKNNRVVYSIHNWRFAPQFLLIRRWIEEGLIGKLSRIELQTLRTAPAFARENSSKLNGNWRLDVSQAGGGVLVDHGWHLFSLALSLAREAPKSLWARLNREKFAGSSLEDTAICGVEFPSVKGVLTMSWAETRRRNWGVFLGERGGIFLDDDKVWLNSSGAPLRCETFAEPLSAGSFHPDWFERMLPDFFHEIEHPESRTNFEEASACLELLSAAYESDRRASQLVEVGRAGAPVAS